MRISLAGGALIAATILSLTGCYSNGRWSMPNLAFWKSSPFSSSPDAKGATNPTKPSSLASTNAPAFVPGANPTTPPSTTAPGTNGSYVAPGVVNTAVNGYPGANSTSSIGSTSPVYTASSTNAVGSGSYVAPQQGFYNPIVPPTTASTAPSVYGGLSSGGSYSGAASPTSSTPPANSPGGTLPAPSSNGAVPGAYYNPIPNPSPASGTNYGTSAPGAYTPSGSYTPMPNSDTNPVRPPLSSPYAPSGTDCANCAANHYGTTDDRLESSGDRYGNPGDGYLAPPATNNNSAGDSSNDVPPSGAPMNVSPGSRYAPPAASSGGEINSSPYAPGPSATAPLDNGAGSTPVYSPGSTNLYPSTTSPSSAPASPTTPFGGLYNSAPYRPGSVTEFIPRKSTGLPENAPQVAPTGYVQPIESGR